MNSVTRAGQKFGKKLSKLIDVHWGSQTAFALELGVSRQKVNNWTKGSVPPASVLLYVARRGGTTLEWLLDDEAPAWPPSPQADVSQIPTDHLMDELVKRYLQHAVSFYNGVHKIPEGDWEGTAIWLLSNNAGKEIPPEIWKMAKFIEAMESQLTAIQMIDVEAAITDEVRHSKTIDIPPFELTPKVLEQYWNEQREMNPGINAIAEYMAVETTAKSGPAKRRKDEWMGTRSPYLLARLVTHESVEFEPKLKPLRKALRQAGFLDREGKPTEPKGFIPPQVKD